MSKLAKKISAAGLTAYTMVYCTLAANAATATSTFMGFKGTAETFAFTVINYILGAAGLVAVIYLIIGGFNYITAGGNEEQNKKATKTLLNAVIGLVVIFAAYAIVVTVQNALPGTELIDTVVDENQ
ncbi:MAG: pilin [Patescibacteria group bacterium]